MGTGSGVGKEGDGVNTITLDYPDQEPLMYGQSVLCLSATEVAWLIAHLQAARADNRAWVTIRCVTNGVAADGRTLADDMRAWAEQHAGTQTDG